MKTFEGNDGNTYLVFKTGDSFHVFVEVEAKQAARECGAEEENNTRIMMWSQLWNQKKFSMFSTVNKL